MDLTDRVALVVGGASGIGYAVRERLQDAGATVVWADVARGSGVEPCDIRDERQVDLMVSSVVGKYGRLDFAVNAAGISGTSALLADRSTSEWNEMLAVNLSGTFFCLRAELRAMMTNKSGSIVSISSAGGLSGVPTLAHYSAAKFGVIGLTKSAAQEYAERGIRVNAVCPGPINTPMLKNWSGTPGALEELGKQTPLGRLGEPKEVADAVLWLLSDDASYVTGIALEVDGGSAARR
jgi:NAD(P)-dependent dehydrogenase (short-subunit alcohol dehydrogenase family)